MSLVARIVLALLNFAGALTEAARERRLLKAGEDRVIAESLRRAADELARAQAARDQARARADAAPRDGGLPDDGWRRD